MPALDIQNPDQSFKINNTPHKSSTYQITEIKKNLLLIIFMFTFVSGLFVFLSAQVCSDSSNSGSWDKSPLLQKQLRLMSSATFCNLRSKSANNHVKNTQIHWFNYGYNLHHMKMNLPLRGLRVLHHKLDLTQLYHHLLQQVPPL